MAGRHFKNNAPFTDSSEKPEAISEDPDNAKWISMKLLIVDESEEVRDWVSEIIADGYRLQAVELAKTLRKAATILRSINPDIVILDVHLPDGCGTDFLSDIRSMQPQARTIVLTNHSHVYYQLKAHRAGADYFFDKSIGPMMLKTVLEHLGRQHAQRASRGITCLTGYPECSQ
ncbi:MAG TPA: response regulator [Sulfuricella sp.]|nr:response regulator [Sulfuricella sp.]